MPRSANLDCLRLAKAIEVLASSRLWFLR